MICEHPFDKISESQDCLANREEQQRPSTCKRVRGRTSQALRFTEKLDLIQELDYENEMTYPMQ